MPELITVALVCVSTLTAAECNRNTAIDVVVRPAASAYECAMGAQATMAANGMVEPGTYLKIACERRRVAHAAAE